MGVECAVDVDGDGVEPDDVLTAGGWRIKEQISVYRNTKILIPYIVDMDKHNSYP